MKGQQTFSIEGPLVNILGSVGHRVFITITQLCHCSMKVEKVSKQISACANTALFMDTNIGFPMIFLCQEIFVLIFSNHLKM